MLGMQRMRSLDGSSQAARGRRGLLQPSRPSTRLSGGAGFDRQRELSHATPWVGAERCRACRLVAAGHCGGTPSVT